MQRRLKMLYPLLYKQIYSNDKYPLLYTIDRFFALAVKLKTN